MTLMFQVFLLQVVLRSAHAVLCEDSSCAIKGSDDEASQAQVLMQMQRATWKNKQVIPIEEQLPLLPGLGSSAATGKVLTENTHEVEDREDANGMIRTSQGPGAYEPLSEAGYQTVASSCCNYQMEEYVRRIVVDLGLELCGEGGLNGIVPFYVCSNAQDFDTLRKDLVDKSTMVCPVAASPGGCPADTSSCPGVEDKAAHRRRTCRGAVNTTVAVSTTTAASTTTTTTTIESTTVTTTTTATTTVTTTTVTTTTIIETTAVATTVATTEAVTKTTTTTMPAVTTTTTTSTGCKGETDVLDIFNSQLQQSNLGGQGPDAGATNMRFEGVGNLDGRPYDLVVESTSAYTPGNNLDNGYECGQPAAGCVNGRFVKISVAAGTSVDLTFKFQDSATQDPVTVPRLLFSVHDIDQLSNDAREHVYITGYDDDVIVNADAEFTHSVQPDGKLRLRSTHDGTSADDPLNPLHLKSVTVDGVAIDQMKRSAAFVYSETSSISLTLEVTCDTAGGGCPAGTSRSFLFTGDTNLVSCSGKAL